MRKSSICRKTDETDIRLELNLDGRGNCEVDTGIGFFDHMLTLFAKHGLVDMSLKVSGDLEVDGHHTVEDTGIVLGRALKEAVGDKVSIKRYGYVLLPMDEALILISIDFSGRPCLIFDVELDRTNVGGLDTELIEEFLRGFVNNSGVTLHVKLIHGSNTHHIIEAIFKGLGRSIKEAVSKDDRVEGVPSTKGIL